MSKVILMAPAQYWKLSKEEKQDLIGRGGCGPGQGVGDKLVPDNVLWINIQPACEIHDYCYLVAEATISAKERADRIFLNNMTRIIRARSGCRWLMRRRLKVAYGYYLAVKHFGAPSFWKGKNVLGEERQVSI